MNKGQAQRRPVTIDYFKTTKKEETDASDLKAWVESFGDSFNRNFWTSNLAQGSPHHDIYMDDTPVLGSVIIREDGEYRIESIKYFDKNYIIEQ